MTGVNDLAGRWYRYGEEDCMACANELCETARTAWKPVSEPPTEADAEGVLGLVIYRNPRAGVVQTFPWDEIPYVAPWCEWARISEVVLLPEGSGE